MALNLQTFKTRAITAVVFVAVMLTGLLWNSWSFLMLFGIIHFGCWYELIKLAKKISKKNYLAFSLLGLIYISLPILAMLDLGISWKVRNGDDRATEIIYSNIIPCGIIFSIWINDTMAYLVGSWIGKTPFSKISPKKTWEGTIGGAILCIVVIGLIGKTPFSKISPKKTWEGTIGGAILCIAVIGLMGYYIPVAKIIEVKHWIAIAAICAIFGTLGDLLESKLKRTGNVKDSGSIMPGHGGFLDRFDSLLIATPFVWLYISFFL